MRHYYLSLFCIHDNVNLENISQVLKSTIEILKFNNLEILIRDNKDKKEFILNDKYLDLDKVLSLYNKNRSLSLSHNSDSSFGHFGIHNSFFSLHYYLNFELLDPTIVETFFIDALNKTSVDFGFISLDHANKKQWYEVSYGAHVDNIGIMAGLRDIYWINYYGKPFIDIIGKEKLLNLETVYSEVIGEGVYFKVADSPEDVYEKKNIIKQDIGEKYFIKKNKELEEYRKKSNFIAEKYYNIYGFIRSIWRLLREPEDRMTAEIMPHFPHLGRPSKFLMESKENK